MQCYKITTGRWLQDDVWYMDTNGEQSGMLVICADQKEEHIL